MVVLQVADPGVHRITVRRTTVHHPGFSVLEFAFFYDFSVAVQGIAYQCSHQVENLSIAPAFRMRTDGDDAPGSIILFIGPGRRLPVHRAGQLHRIGIVSEQHLRLRIAGFEQRHRIASIIVEDAVHEVVAAKIVISEQR